MKLKRTILFITVTILTIFSCEPPKTPIDYYNSAVSRSNYSSSFFLRMNQAIRDREQGEYTNYDLVGNMKFPSEYTEHEITKLKALLGNEGSDNLIQVAIESAKYEDKLFKGSELKAVYKAIDDSPNVKALQENLAPHSEFLEKAITEYNTIFEKLNSEITKYAKDNNIEETTINIP